MEITRYHRGCPLKDETIRNSGTPAVVIYTHDKPDRLELMKPRYFDAIKPPAGGYTGNQLTTLTESARSSSATDIYAPGSAPIGTYTYDGNGNMVSDSRRGLTLGYNYLKLLREVKAGSTVKARYTWLTDGSKLKVRDAGSNGFDYLGSLIYKSSSAGVRLETASFGEGVIRASVSNSGQYEVNYFLTDQVGSVRVIVDGNGGVLERNDYYPFGARHIRSDYPQLAANRFKYTGKEVQVTGELNYLDHGARMYDSGLGRWFGMDPMAEKYGSWSPFNYTLNSPIRFIDPNGMWVDTWIVNSYGYIEYFKNNYEDRLYFANKDWELVSYMKVKDRRILDQLVRHTTIDDKMDPAYERDLSFATGGENMQSEMFRTFLFLADNTDVEWRIDHYLDDRGASKYSLGTLHDTGLSPGAEHMGHSAESVKAFIHSHPNIATDTKSEIESMGWISKSQVYGDSDVGIKMTNTSYNKVGYYTYFPRSQNLWSVNNHGIKPHLIRSNVLNYRNLLFGKMKVK